MSRWCRQDAGMQGISLTVSAKVTARTPQSRRAAWRESLTIIILLSSGFTVEVQGRLAGQADELVLMPDFDAPAGEGIQAQLDFEGAQTQRHLVELAVQSPRAVLAHGAGELDVEEPVDVFGGIAV